MADNNADRYLELLKQSLVNQLYLETEAGILQLASTAYFNAATPSDSLIQDFLGAARDEICSRLQSEKEAGGFLRVNVHDEDGKETEAVDFRNFVFTSHCMMGRACIDQLHQCMHEITRDNISGDFIEAGAWKGGAGIFMRGYLAAHDIADRRVWLADSFEGYPKAVLPQDQTVEFGGRFFPYQSVSQDAVAALFSRYELWDDQVGFLKGWFKDTLTTTAIKQLALLRLDADLYESTMDGLLALYDKLVPGGFVIIDGYFLYSGCKVAVDTFRNLRGIRNDLVIVGGRAVSWRKGVS